MKKFLSFLTVICLLVLAFPLMTQTVTYACPSECSSERYESCIQTPDTSLPQSNSKNEELIEAKHPPDSNGSTNITINIYDSDVYVNENSDFEQIISPEAPRDKSDSTKHSQDEEAETDFASNIFDFLRDIIKSISVVITLESNAAREMLLSKIRFGK